MNAPSRVIVSGGFDDLRSRHLRFLEEAAKLGDVTVLVWPDELIARETGRPPKRTATEKAKREYCESMGIEYLVLKRTPAPGLPAQQHGTAQVLK